MINHTWGDSSVFMCLSCILESYISHTSIKYTNFTKSLSPLLSCVYVDDGMHCHAHWQTDAQK